MTNLDYRKLLRMLDTITTVTGKKEFDSGVLALKLLLPVKNASNDLRRLYLMGFLKKKRVKRSALSKTGKVCNKGYKYIYNLSSQGLKYLEYMKNPNRMEQKDAFDAVLHQMSKDYLMSKYQEHEANMLVQILEGIDRKDRNPRFSYLNKIPQIYFEYRKAELDRTKTKQDEKIRALENELANAKSLLNEATTRISQLTEVLKRLAKIEKP